MAVRDGRGDVKQTTTMPKIHHWNKTW